MGKTSLKPTSVTQQAHAIASSEAKRRKAKGICSSITAVISEAVIKEYGDTKNG